MIIIWRGNGILIPVIAAVVAFLTAALLGSHGLAWPIGFFAAAAVLFLITAKTKIFGPYDSLYYVPARYWPVILVVFGVVNYVSNTVA